MKKSKSSKEKFIAAMKKGYPTSSDALILGTAIFAGKPIEKLRLLLFFLP